MAQWELITPDSLAELDSGQNTKLGGIATGATVGATVGTNFFKSGTTTNYGIGEFENAQLGFSVSNNSLTLGRGSASSLVLSGLGQSLVGLSGVVNNADVTSANTSANTSNVGNQTVANAQTAVARANAGLNSSGDVVRTVSTSYGGTGHNTNVTAFENGAMSISTSGNAITLGRGAYSGTSISGLGQALVNLSGVTNNADQTSANTSAATSTVNGVAASTVQAGAAAGATANQDSTSSIRSGTTKANVGLGNVANESRATILGGNLTGTIGGVANSTVRSGAAAGATANQDSTSSIRSGTTKANVGLGNVANESRATILGGNLTGSINSIAVSTVTNGAAAGATANQDSTSTIRGGVTTASITGGSNSHVWTIESSSEYAPNTGSIATTIEWRSGTGALLTSATITSTLNTSDRNIDIARSGSGVTFGGGQSNIGAAGSTTTATYNSIKVSVFHAVIDTSSWTFK